MISTKDIPEIKDENISSLQETWVPLDITNKDKSGKLRLSDLFRIFSSFKGVEQVITGIALKFNGGRAVGFTQGQAARIALIMGPVLQFDDGRAVGFSQGFAATIAEDFKNGG